jgi:hypothetical protein
MADGVNRGETPRGGNFYAPFSYKSGLEDFEGVGERRLGFDSMGVEVTGVFKEMGQPVDADMALEALKARKRAAKALSEKKKGASRYREAANLVAESFTKYRGPKSYMSMLVRDSMVAAVVESRKFAQGWRSYMINLNLARELFDVNEVDNQNSPEAVAVRAMCDMVKCMSQYGKAKEVSRAVFLDQMAWTYASAMGWWVEQDTSNGAGGSSAGGSSKSNGANGQNLSWAERMARIPGRWYMITNEVSAATPPSVATGVLNTTRSVVSTMAQGLKVLVAPPKPLKA